MESPQPPTLHALTPPPPSSIMNVPGESTLRREFLRLQQENKSNSEAVKQQLQQQQLQQQRDPEAHIQHLLHQRQRRIEEQKEERRRVEEVWGRGGALSAGGVGEAPAPQGVPFAWTGRSPLSLRALKCPGLLAQQLSGLIWKSLPEILLCFWLFGLDLLENTYCGGWEKDL